MTRCDARLPQAGAAAVAARTRLAPWPTKKMRVVTADGYENLTGAIPKEPDELAAMVAER